MTPAATVSRDQPTLFDEDQPHIVERDSLQNETDAATLSVMRDKRSEARLEKLASRLRHTVNPLDRARLAAELRGLAEAALANAVDDARHAGRTWRDIGNELDIPFQTLYRRYGGDERS